MQHSLSSHTGHPAAHDQSSVDVCTFDKQRYFISVSSKTSVPASRNFVKIDVHVYLIASAVNGYLTVIPQYVNPPSSAVNYSEAQAERIEYAQGHKRRQSPGVVP